MPSWIVDNVENLLAFYLKTVRVPGVTLVNGLAGRGRKS